MQRLDENYLCIRYNQRVSDNERDVYRLPRTTTTTTTTQLLRTNCLIRRFKAQEV